MLMKRLFPVALLLVVLVAACSDSGGDKPTGPGGGGTSDSASFSLTVRPIVASRCATSSCHGSATGQGGLIFSSNNPTYASITGITSPSGDFVVPGSSATSNFYLKIIPVVPTPPGGPRMPNGGPYLSTGQQAAIMRWIDNGALDN